MNTNLQMEERLWAYIDGHVSGSEKSGVEALIAEQAAWREKYQELLAMHSSLQLTELEEPSLRFSKNVMEEISRLQIAPATKTYINKKIVAGIGIFFISLLAAILIYGFSQMDFSSPGSAQIEITLEKIDISKFFNNTLINVFLMINVLLGLVLLDFYLSNKRNLYRKDTR